MVVVATVLVIATLYEHKVFLRMVKLNLKVTQIITVKA